MSEVYLSKYYVSMKSFSKITLGILLIINLLSLAHFRNWNEWLLINGDSMGYYAYLPMTFIHHDFKTLRLQTFHRTKNMADHRDENYTPETMPDRWIPGVVAPNGNHVNIYTCGVAMLQLPFFTIAHILAQPLGFVADGYSLPYRFMLLLGNVFYVMLGLWFLRKILRGYFSELITSLTLAIVMLTTNLYYFTAFNGFMAHSYVFCLVAILIFFTTKWHETTGSRYLIGLGFIGGLITLIRPTDVLFLLIPLLYKSTSLSSFLEKIRMFWSKKTSVLVAFVAFLLPFLPQLFYWKYVTGNWIYNSYGDYFKFDFAHPHIQEGVIGMNNGWLVYTPVMAFAIIGIFMMRDKRRDFLLPVITFLLIYIYVIYAWWSFNYINGFGSRPMIDAYALLAIPLSIFVEKMQKTRVLFSIFLVLIGFLTWLNIFQTEQMSHQILISEQNNEAFWIESFGKTTLTYNALVAFDANELQPKQSVFVKSLFENGFENPVLTDSNYVKQPVANGQYAYRINPAAYSPACKTEVKNIQGGRYVKVSLKAYSSKNSIWDIYEKSMLVIEFRRGDKEIKWRGIRIENKIGNTIKIYGGQTEVWGDIHFFVKIPEDALPDDMLSCYIWNQNKGALVIDDFKVELYK